MTSENTNIDGKRVVIGATVQSTTGGATGSPEPKDAGEPGPISDTGATGATGATGYIGRSAGTLHDTSVTGPGVTGPQVGTNG